MAPERRRLEIVDSTSSALLHALDDVLDLPNAETGQLRIDAVPDGSSMRLAEIAVRSAPGEGSEFHVGIPLPVTSDMPVGDLVAGTADDPHNATPLVDGGCNATARARRGRITPRAGCGSRTNSVNCVWTQ
ncbi:hypothetical protein [Burkholderia territorii]|uniref:hypothetical protein n=1 Tax=Burkholderia territorii TaxID=1503055 RepID=UPI000AC87EB7|nr:hypothetical protein [Burkholderia territorii]